VVTAEAGRIGTPPLIVIQDATAGIAIRLEDADPRPARGTRLLVTGVLADPYGQLELRSVSTLTSLGAAAQPAPTAIDASLIGDAVEARLVTVTGTAATKPVRSTSGDLTVDLTVAGGTIRVAMDSSSGIPPSLIGAGDRLRVTGVVGQRASRKGAADGFRVWARDQADVVRLPSGPPTPSPAPSTPSSPRPSTSPSSSGAPSTGSVASIASAIAAGSGDVTVEGVVTVKPTLLDTTGRRIVIQDDSGGIEVLLPTRASPPPLGTRVRVHGEIGRAYGAPRLKADSVRVLGRGSVTAIELRTAPAGAHEWRVVRVRGDVVDVHRSGQRWQAELLVAGIRVPILGLAGASIPSSAVVKGRTATIVGIVRRPYPSASDRRFAVLPRSATDLTMGGPADDATGGSPQGVAGRGEAAGTTAGAGISPPSGSAGDGSPVEIDLVAINDHVGEVVRVGGLVAALRPDGFDLDDGTSVERVVIRGPAVAVAATIVPDDAVALVGRIERLDDGSAAVAVDDPAGIVLAGDPTAGTANPSGSTGPAAADASGVVATGVPAVVAGLAEPAIPGVGAAGIVLIGFASLAVTLLRRHRMRRQIAARIARRLDELVGTAGTQAAGGAAFGAPSIAALTSTRPTAGPPRLPGDVP
jgi:hypothetical protein